MIQTPTGRRASKHHRVTAVRPMTEHEGITMRTAIVVTTCLILGFLTAPASAARCKFKADRSAELSGEGVVSVEIFVLAGDLSVSGVEGADTIRAEGEGCVSKEGMLEVMDITMRRSDDRVQIFAEMPDISGDNDSEWEDQFAVMDMEIDLPTGMAVIVHDSSGDLRISRLASAEITDSSGMIEVVDVPGDILIPQDSSGDIQLERVGSVTIQVDSSGEIMIEDAASVTIANDTSGEIRLRNIRGDVLIGNDSSGGIDVRDVGGSFVVENDTSGGIRHRNVAGAVSLPEYRNEG